MRQLAKTEGEMHGGNKQESVAQLNIIPMTLARQDWTSLPQTTYPWRKFEHIYEVATACYSVYIRTMFPSSQKTPSVFLPCAHN